MKELKLGKLAGNVANNTAFNRTMKELKFA